LGLWHGEYQGIIRAWLRWYDEQGNWIPTDSEQLEQERQQKELLIDRLRSLGLNPNDVLG
jgi:hypothetical protein